MQRDRIRIGLALASGMAIAVTHATASPLITQTSETNPTTNGFTLVTCCGAGATGVGKIDNGTPVWALGGGDTADQFGYARALTGAEAGAIAAKPFVVTVSVRVLAGSAPAFSQATPVTIADSFLDNGKVRWEMDIGVNANGDPVVVLPTSHDNNGSGGAILSHGASYVLTGAGNSFNRYQLLVAAGKASLYINGNRVMTGYTGDTSFVGNTGLAFSTNSGGQSDYNLVELSSTLVLP